MTPDRKIRLLVVVASGRGWASRFGGALATMMLHLGMKGIQDADGSQRLERCAIQIHHGAYLVKARNDHILAAIAGDFTHMLSLDDDMTFPPDAIQRLFAHDKGVVTCNYRKKLPDRVEFCCTGFDGRQVTSVGKTGIEQIGWMGMGLTLIDIAKIAHVPPPYFEVVWNHRTSEYIIEDGVFSALLHRHGVEIWCDHDLSQRVGHVGDFEFTVPTVSKLELVTSQESPNEKVQIAS